MAVNKVEINGKPVIDLTKDTVLPQTLLSGVTAHNAAGESIVGAVAVAPGSATLPKAPGEAAVGEENTFARGDHVHPKEVSDTDRAAWGGKANLAISEIPKGRMRGDIRGIGKVGTSEDIQNSGFMNKAVDPTNPDSWACDVNTDGSINYTDMNEISGFGKWASVLTKTPTFADFYNNWTYHKVDDLTGYWTTNLVIPDVTAEMNVSISVQGLVPENTFIKAEPLAGGVRIHANYPPIRALPCSVTYGEGTGQGSICAAEGVSNAQLETTVSSVATKAIAVELLASKWSSSSKTQVVSAPGVLQEDEKQQIIAMPWSDQITEYYDAGIRYVGRDDDRLTFKCETIPTVDLWVLVSLTPLTFVE
nr:MAG TPA: hypothetical protein [Caudoviricetes sp.]